MTGQPYQVQNYELAVNQLLDLYQAHRVQHPDFDQCGGVGACLMMRAEVKAEQRIEGLLRRVAEDGIRITIGARP